MASTPCVSKGPVQDSTYCAYPSPLAKYEEVTKDSKLFMFTLEKLHAEMGTKFMIPVIGGKELDLHRLFVEVTSRGGFQKIIKERNWKEVTAVFNFPSTATNASFVLRKYYSSLLSHYEQLYYFKAPGWTPPTTSDASPSKSTILSPTQNTLSLQPRLGLHSTVFRQSSPNATVLPQDASPSPSISTMLSPTQNTLSLQPRLGIYSKVFRQSSPKATVLRQAMPASSAGSAVIGVIDGKFDSGYLVTVTIGSEKLKGVLYQTPENTTFSDNNNNGSTHSGLARRRRRKKSEIRRRDPALPKPNRSGYNFFFAEQHARLKSRQQGVDRDFSRVIGDLWNKLNESEKSVYQEKAVEDKERYLREMDSYREKLKSDQVICDAVPLQQRHPYPDTDMVDAEADCYQTPEESSSGESNHEDDGSIEKDFDVNASHDVIA